MSARIFSPPKNPMQSGRGKLDAWVLEFDTIGAKTVDPLMGWISSGDTNSQVRLNFQNKDEAIAYAVNNGIEYTVSEPKIAKRIIRSYSENFAFNKREPWSH